MVALFNNVIWSFETHFGSLGPYDAYDGGRYSRPSSHSGRRTFLTSLANKGTAIHILKTLAGHRNIATTAAYLYSSPAQLRAAVELV